MPSGGVTSPYKFSTYAKKLTMINNLEKSMSATTVNFAGNVSMFLSILTNLSDLELHHIPPVCMYECIPGILN